MGIRGKVYEFSNFLYNDNFCVLTVSYKAQKSKPLTNFYSSHTFSHILRYTVQKNTLVRDAEMLRITLFVCLFKIKSKSTKRNDSFFIDVLILSLREVMTQRDSKVIFVTMLFLSLENGKNKKW